MRTTAFRVQMYKGILDSGWIHLEDLTAIVGKNESGKTSLLRALHKFNPHTADSYSFSEFPRGHRDKRSLDQVVSSVKLDLSDDELAELKELTGTDVPKTVIVRRDYGGRFECEFENGILSEKLHPNEIDAICNNLPAIPNDSGLSFKDTGTSGLETLRRLAREGRFTELETEAGAQVKALERVRSNPQQNAAAHQAEQQFITQLTQKAKAIQAYLGDAKTPKEKAHDFVVARLPTFIYMDDYRIFSGTANLQHVQQNRNKKTLSGQEETLLMLLELAELDLDEQVKQAAANDREERRHDLNDAGVTLTRMIEDRWRQRQYEVEFDADGVYFFTWVKGVDERHRIKLEERSRGFQWFFSFDMMFMHESQGTFRGCVLLLDEPGLHLHPDGQQDLLRRLESYAEENTLIYTTHLPFMLDLRRPERIRVLRSDGPKGATVSDDLNMTQPDEKLTLQAALGMSGRTSYLLAERNLVVEGVDDFWVTTELSNLLARSGKEALSEDIMITAAGGASEAAYIAALMIGQELQVAVLLDSDPAGDQAADKLVKKWLTRYKGSEATILRLGEAVGSKSAQFSLEDMFPEDYYWKKVREAYAREDQTHTFPAEIPSGSAMLSKRVESFFDSVGVKFNKGRVAKLIRRDLRGMRKSEELPAGVEDKAERLMKAISEAFRDR